MGRDTRADLLDTALTKAVRWDPKLHPRYPKGTPGLAGKFAPKPGSRVFVELGGGRPVSTDRGRRSTGVVTAYSRDGRRARVKLDSGRELAFPTELIRRDQHAQRVVGRSPSREHPAVSRQRAEQSGRTYYGLGRNEGAARDVAAREAAMFGTDPSWFGLHNSKPGWTQFNRPPGGYRVDNPDASPEFTDDLREQADRIAADVRGDNPELDTSYDVYAGVVNGEEIGVIDMGDVGQWTFVRGEDERLEMAPDNPNEVQDAIIEARGFGPRPEPINEHLYEYDIDAVEERELKEFVERADAWSGLGWAVQEQAETFAEGSDGDREEYREGGDFPEQWVSELNANAVNMIERFVQDYYDSDYDKFNEELDKLKEWSNLGGAIQDQFKAILDQEALADQNINALGYIRDWAGRTEYHDLYDALQDYLGNVPGFPTSMRSQAALTRATDGWSSESALAVARARALVRLDDGRIAIREGADDAPSFRVFDQRGNVVDTPISSPHPELAPPARDTSEFVEYRGDNLQRDVLDRMKVGDSIKVVSYDDQGKPFRTRYTRTAGPNGNITGTWASDFLDPPPPHYEDMRARNVMSRLDFKSPVTVRPIGAGDIEVAIAGRPVLDLPDIRPPRVKRRERARQRAELDRRLAAMRAAFDRRRGATFRALRGR